MSFLDNIKEEKQKKVAENWFKFGERAVDPEKKIEYYTQSLEANPGNPVVWTAKGRALEALKRFQEARKCYVRARELEPVFRSELEAETESVEMLESQDEREKSGELKETIKEFRELTPEAASEVTSETTPEATSEAIPEATSETTPKVTSEVIPEAIPEAILEAIPEATSETTQKVTSEAIPEAIPKATSEAIPEVTGQDTEVEIEKEPKKIERIAFEMPKKVEKPDIWAAPQPEIKKMENEMLGSEKSSINVEKEDPEKEWIKTGEAVKQETGEEKISEEPEIKMAPEVKIPAVENAFPKKEIETKDIEAVESGIAVGTFSSGKKEIVEMMSKEPDKEVNYVNIRISWGEAIKFWLAGAVAMLLVWVLVFVLFSSLMGVSLF